MELITTQKPALYEGGNTKKEIDNLALLLVNETLEKGTPLELAEKIAATENLIKAIKSNDRYTDYLKEQLSHHSGKYTSESGTKIEVCETAVSFDYSQNPQWVELDKTIASLDVRRKQLEERLRKIPAGKLLVDEESGETLVGPSKSSKSSYKVTLSK